MRTSSFRRLVVVLVLLMSALGTIPVARPSVVVAQTQTFQQAQDITIANSSAPSKAEPYPLTINVPSGTGFVTAASVTLNGLTHSAAFDLDILLVGPTGRTVLLMSDAGRTSNLNDATLTFRDGSAPLPETTSIPNGTYRPTNYGTGDVFPSPAPTPPRGGYGTTLATFNSVNRAGTWQLYILDDLPIAFSGSLARGWSLTLTINLIEGSFNQTFSTSAGARIENVAPANPYPSQITVSNIPGVTEHLRVSITLSHTSPDDLDILLVGPGASTGVVLMSDVGGSTDLSNVTLTFDDAASGALPDTNPLTTGTFQPTDIDAGTDDAFVHPAPTGNRGHFLSTFIGDSPNAVWSLYVLDDRPSADTGTIHAWSLEIDTNEPPVLDPVPNIVVDVKTGRDVPLHATDPDGDSFGWVEVNLPGYADIVDHLDGDGFATLRLTPDEDYIGVTDTAIIAVGDAFVDVETSFQITVVDDRTPPSYALDISAFPGPNGWFADDVTYTLTGLDEQGGSGIRAIRYRLEGATELPWTEVEAAALQVTVAAEGETRLFFQVFDYAGNHSGLIQPRVKIDKTPPVVTSVTARLALSGQVTLDPNTQAYAVPIEGRWAATDAVSGIAVYQLQLEDSLGITPQALADPLARRAVVQVVPERCLCAFLVTATDLADNPDGPVRRPFRPTLHDDATSDTTYSSGWVLATNGQHINGHAHTASSAGPTATFTFTGRSVAWIASFGPARGVAEVTLDGGSPVLVDLYAPSAQQRQLAFTANGLTNSAHTLVVRVTGDKNLAATASSIVIDGFIVLH